MKEVGGDLIAEGSDAKPVLDFATVPNMTMYNCMSVSNNKLFLRILAIYKLILETLKFHFQTSFQLMSCFTALLPPPPVDYIPPKDQKQQNFMRYFDTFMLPYSFLPI